MQVHSQSPKTESNSIEEELKKITQKHLLKFEAAVNKSTKQRADSIREPNRYKPVNYLPEVLKDSLKFWSTKKQVLSEFSSENPIDVLILGPDKSGKTSLIKALSGDDKLYAATSSKVNDILDITFDNVEIKCREVSYSFIKSWETHQADAKIIMLLIDANNLQEYSFAMIESLILLSKFNRPFLLIINKIDLIESGRDSEYSIVEEILQVDRLQQEHPQCCVFGFSVMSRSHINHLKDWLKQTLRLFGELKKSEPSPSKSSPKKKGLCC